MITNFAKSAELTVAATDPNEWRDGVETGISENVKMGVRRTLREDLFASMFINAAKEWDGVEVHQTSPEIIQGMVRSGELSTDQVEHLLRPHDGGFTPPRVDARKGDNFLETFHGDVKFDKEEGRLERYQKVAASLRAEEEDVFSRATATATVSRMAASLPLFVADPPNLAAMAVGPWGHVARSGRLAYAAIAAEQALVALATAPSVWENKKALGVPYGAKDVAANIGMTVAGGMAFKGAFDIAKGLKSQIKAIKTSPAAETMEGQQAIANLEDAAAEVEIARQSGRPLDEVLDEADKFVEDLFTPKPGKDVNNPGEVPGVKAYEDDIKLQEDYDALMTQRADVELPEVKAVPEAKAPEQEVKPRAETPEEIVIADLDTEMERTLMAKGCFGG